MPIPPPPRPPSPEPQPTTARKLGSPSKSPGKNPVYEDHRGKNYFKVGLGDGS